MAPSHTLTAEYKHTYTHTHTHRFNGRDKLGSDGYYLEIVRLGGVVEQAGLVIRDAPIIGR